jgi:hypothetical protein
MATTFTLRFRDDELLARIKQAAKEADRSTAAEIERRLRTSDDRRDSVSFAPA